MRLKESMI